MPAVPSSASRCPRPASGVRCECPASRVPVHPSAVHCPVRASERPGVRRPVSSAGVRCVRPGGRGGWRWGQAAAWLRWPGSPACPRPVRRLPGLEPGGRGWRRPCWASGGVGLDLAVVVGGGWAVARSTAWATRIGWMCAGIARWWRARVRSELATTLCGHRVRPRAESPGRCEPPGLDCDLRVRPWCGRSELPWV